MKLVLKRSQKKGSWGGKPTFVLESQAVLTDEEKEHINKYHLADTMIYTSLEDRGSGILGFVSRHATGVEITVGDLVRGKTVECKDIVEMIGVEEQIKQACQNFKLVLNTAAEFGGEEIIEYT